MVQKLRTHVGVDSCVPLHWLHAKTPRCSRSPPSLSPSAHTLSADSSSSCTVCRVAAILHRERGSVPLPSLYLARLVCVCVLRYLKPPPPPPPPSPPPPPPPTRANPPPPFLPPPSPITPLPCANLLRCCFCTGHSSTMNGLNFNIKDTGALLSTHMVTVQYQCSG